MTKILIVEDEPGIYTFLQEGLTDEGYETLVAIDGYYRLMKTNDIDQKQQKALQNVIARKITV